MKKLKVDAVVLDLRHLTEETLAAYDKCEMEAVFALMNPHAQALLNQYGVIAVNPEKYPEVNIEGANTFIEWICSSEGQEAIREFGVEEFGQALFIPNAGEEK